jgi:hypothetical protein
MSFTEVRVLRLAVVTGLALALAMGRASAQEAPFPGDLLKNAAVKAALDGAKASETQTIADQIRFCEIPAPPFKEEVRGRELQRVFEQLGLQNVRAAPPRRHRRAPRHRVSRRHRRQGEA